MIEIYHNNHFKHIVSDSSLTEPLQTHLDQILTLPKTINYVLRKGTSLKSTQPDDSATHKAPSVTSQPDDPLVTSIPAQPDDPVTHKAPSVTSQSEEEVERKNSRNDESKQVSPKTLIL